MDVILTGATWTCSCSRGSYVALFLFPWELCGPVPIPVGATPPCSYSLGSYVDLFLFLEESCADVSLFLEGPVWICSCQCEGEAAQPRDPYRSSSIHSQYAGQAKYIECRRGNKCLEFIAYVLDKPSRMWKSRQCLVFINLRTGQAQ